LIISAFFFLLRVGEYTRSKGKHRTIPLQKKDIWLWRAGIVIPNNALLEVLLTTNAITMCLENQKCGHKNAVLHHASLGNATINLVTSVAFLIHAVQNLSMDTPWGFSVTQTNKSNTSQQVRAAVPSTSEIPTTISPHQAIPCLASGPIVSDPVGQCT
jgi:hypothetical protein